MSFNLSELSINLVPRGPAMVGDAEESVAIPPRDCTLVTCTTGTPACSGTDACTVSLGVVDYHGLRVELEIRLNGGAGAKAKRPAE